MSARVLLLDGPLGDASASPAARHAAALAAAVRDGAPDAELLGETVFADRLSTSAALVAAALRRAAEREADIVLCAFGMARPDPAIGAAVAAAAAAGRIVVASAPARGGPVWPAGFAEAVSVQGDARCAAGEWSRLDLPHARFGACPRSRDPAVGGASVAAAHFAGLLAARLPAAPDPRAALDGLRRDAPHQGRERRR